MAATCAARNSHRVAPGVERRQRRNLRRHRGRRSLLDRLVAARPRDLGGRGPEGSEGHRVAVDRAAVALRHLGRRPPPGRRGAQEPDADLQRRVRTRRTARRHRAAATHRSAPRADLSGRVARRQARGLQLADRSGRGHLRHRGRWQRRPAGNQRTRVPPGSSVHRRRQGGHLPGHGRRDMGRPPVSLDGSKVETLSANPGLKFPHWSPTVGSSPSPPRATRTSTTRTSSTSPAARAPGRRADPRPRCAAGERPAGHPTASGCSSPRPEASPGSLPTPKSSSRSQTSAPTARGSPTAGT